MFTINKPRGYASAQPCSSIFGWRMVHMNNGYSRYSSPRTFIAPLAEKPVHKNHVDPPLVSKKEVSITDNVSSAITSIDTVIIREANKRGIESKKYSALLTELVPKKISLPEIKSEKLPFFSHIDEQTAIQIQYAPGSVRISAEKLYAQACIKDHAESAVQKMINQQLSKEAQTGFLYAHMPDYRSYLTEQVNTFIHLFRDALCHEKMSKRIGNRLLFNALTLDEPLGSVLRMVQYWLNHWWFTDDGRLQSVATDYPMLGQLVYFLKCSVHKNSLVPIIRSLHVPDLENALAYQQEKEWFTRTRYIPERMLKKIVEYPYNQQLMQLLDLCSSYQFEQAAQLVQYMNDYNAHLILQEFETKYK